MQFKRLILIIMLFQLVILSGLWLHSRHVHIQTMWLNKTQKANTTEVLKALESCPETSPRLVGPFDVEFNWNRTMEAVRAELSSSLLEGGRYKPPDCISPHKVAIIIPFRNRHQHLIQWLHYHHPILQRQQLDYGVYVINQDGEGTFNKGRLMNVGFIRAMKEYSYTCVVFCDVDLIPMNDRNIYRCFGKPRHLSVAIDKFEFKLLYQSLFGGVVSMSKEQFLIVNGFPNDYWGWGGEDDDFYWRSIFKFKSISRPDMVTGRFKMIKHERDLRNEPNAKRYDKLKRTSLTMEEDGISSLTYTINKVEKDTLYTFITVDVGSPN